MKALTIRQPWASLIPAGAKGNETRSWRTNYRGPLAIHAGIAPYLPLLSIMPENWRKHVEKFFNLQFEQLPLGKIIAVADLVEVHKITPDYIDQLRNDKGIQEVERELALGDYTIGRYAWQLENIRLLPEPIPYKGKQGLFNIDDDIIPENIRNAVQKSAQIVPGGGAGDQE